MIGKQAAMSYYDRDEPPGRGQPSDKSIRRSRNMRKQVEDALAKIRPMLQADGGDLELVDVDAGGVVKVRLRGACAGCPGAKMTLQMGVEKQLKKEVPGVKSVVSV
jgi:Fe-S cluster biogenesis protein NfuA